MTVALATVRESGPIAALGAAYMMLAECESVEDAKDIRDKAEALRVYVRQAGMGLEAQNRCAELKLRAERKAGEMLAGMPKAGNNRQTDTLSGCGVEHHQSSRWQAVASIPEQLFDDFVDGTIGDGKELTTSAALKLAKRLKAGDKADAGELPTIAAGEYRTIVCDPPWQYDNVATRGAAEDHYPTMSQDDLLALELPAADNAHLYLWVTNSFFEDGFDLLRTWGFMYKTCLTWCKPQIGMGNYFRSTTEHVLFGVKGKLPTLRNDVPTHFIADRTQHSKKPDAFYDLVETCSPGPFFEMFARRRRLGLYGEWGVWGNEA